MAKNKKSKIEWRVQVASGGMVVTKRTTAPKTYDFEDEVIRVCESGEVVIDTILAEFPELDGCTQFTLTAK